MSVYETRLVIKNPKRLVLENLPLRAGQQVTVRITVEDENERAQRAERLAAFFRELQSSPKLQMISEEEIAEEIATYRASKN